MKIKNNTGSTGVWVGQTLTNNQEYDIPASDIFKWQGNDLVVQNVSDGTLLIGDGVAYKVAGSEATNFLLGVDTTPKDASGRPLARTAATIDGWHYQLLSVEITTADIGGFYCKDEDGNDVGFITHKLYDVNGAEITDAANEGNATETRFWIKPTHSYEVIGAIFGQASVPATNVWMFVTGLPGVANIKFSRGGINLKHAGTGSFQLVDGRAAKYLAYSAQVPDANSFKFTCKHTAGTQHTFQVSLEIFKAP